MITEHTTLKNKYAGTFNSNYNISSSTGQFGQIDYVYQNELHGFSDTQLNTASGGRLHITSLTLTNTSDHSYTINCYAAASTSTIRFTAASGAMIHPNSTLQLVGPETTKSFAVVNPFQYSLRFQLNSLGYAFDEVYVAGDVSYSINWILETEL